MPEMSRLMIDFSLVGDLVTHEPIMRFLGEGERVDLLTRPYGTGLFSGHPSIGTIHTLAHPNRGRSWLTRDLLGTEREQLGKVLAAQHYSEVYVLQGERAVIRDFIRRWLPLALIREIPEPTGTRPHFRELTRFAIAALSEPGRVINDVPCLHPSPAAILEARGTLIPEHRWIGLQIGSNRTARSVLLKRQLPNLKSPPPALWAGLITRLLESDPQRQVVAYGTAAEGAIFPVIRGLIRPELQARFHDRCGRAPFAKLLGELTVLEGFITCDTGPAHVAAAVGCPSLIFYGPSDPHLWLPTGKAAVVAVQGRAPCMPCLDTSAYERCRSNICLQAITVDEVWQAWQRLRKEVDEQTPQR